MLAIGCACLAIGWMLNLFVEQHTPVPSGVAHFVVGFFFGLSIALNFGAVWISRRRRAQRT